MSLPLRRSIKLGSILKRPISLRVQPSILPSSLPCSSSSSSRLSTPRHFSTSSSLFGTASSSSSDLASTSSDSPSSNISSPISFLPSPSQVYAVPFHKNRTQALDKLSIGVRAHSALLSKSVLKGIAFAFSASYPRLFPGLQVELINMAAVYVPVWAVRANIEGKTNEGEEVAVISKGAWFPGTSVAPLSQLHLQPTLHSLPLTLSKYNPKIDLNQHDMDITPVPFDTSPLVLPSLLPPSSTLDLGDLGEVESSTVRWNKLDAVPIYLPFYVARFKIGTGEDRQDYSLLYDASSPELNDCVMHFPSVPPLYTQEKIRPLTIMHFKQGMPQRPIPRLLSPAFEFDVYPDSSSSTSSSRTKGTTVSTSSKLSSELEDWLEAEGRREELRRLSLAGGEEGEQGGVGRIVDW